METAWQKWRRRAAHNPLNLALDSRVVGWYSAKVASTITATGANVTGLEDMSQAGIDLAQANTGLSPQYTATGINGLPALDFQDSVVGQYRAMANLAASHLTAAPYVKFYNLIRSTNDYRGLNGFSPNAFQTIWGLGNTDTKALAIGAPPIVGNNQTSFGVRQWASDAEAAGFGFTEAAGSYFNDRPILLEIELTATGPHFFMNGIEITPNALINTTLATDLTPYTVGLTQNHFTLGGARNGSGYVDWFEGLLGEGVIVNAAMSDREVNQIRRYLASEWQVTLQERGVLVVHISQSNGLADKGIVEDITNGYDVVSASKNALTISNGASVLRLTNQTSAASGGKFGPEQSMARVIAARTGKPVFVAKEAVGGTDIEWWHPLTGTGGIQLLSELTNVKKLANGAGVIVDEPVLVYYQGEHEAVTEEDSALYYDKLVALKLAWRTALGYPKMKWVDYLIHPDGAGAYTAEVNQAKRDAAAVDNGLTILIDVSATTLVDEDGTFIHVDADGTIDSGTAAGNGIVDWKDTAAVVS